MKYAINVENTNKEFKLTKDRPRSLKAAFLSFKKDKPELVCGLKNINVKIKHGETVAIIGKNGSGKSTLLRIISKIYRPTYGKVEVDGRLSTMLDLGAGFHSELTGRENIFFNAAIMGLTVDQTKGKINTIIDFSELSDFIDAPVRTYSAGMLMRLGFAIATETNPDILLIDEVLAVGDAAFQEKCYDRIESFRQNNNTIIFVSHDLDVARRVALRTIWIDNGQVKMDGNTNDVVDTYLATVPKH